MKCLICQSTKQKIIFPNCLDLEYHLGARYDVYQCSNCGLIYLHSAPNIEELLSFYPLNYHGYVRSVSKLTNFLIHLNIKSRAKLYKKLIGPTGRILEIGAADGRDFLMLNKFGRWDFWGIEFNDQIAKQGKDKGLNVITGTLENHDFKDIKFDMIIMNNLIEHVLDPVEAIGKAKSILKINGVIIGETPNTHSWDFYIFGRYWGGLHIPRHIYLFNQLNLRFLAEKNGFKVKINQKIDTNHWAGSVQNFLQSKRYFRTKAKNGRTWYYPYLLILFIPINFIQMLFGYSGVMRFELKKREIDNFETWNENMAKKYNPEKYHNSSNPIIRFIERKRTQKIIEYLNPKNSDKIIELGCGTGNIMQKINKADQLIGVDVSSFILGAAQTKKYQVKTRFIKANVEKLPVEITNLKFDKIYCSEVLEHVETPTKVLQEIEKIANQNSIIVISIPNESLINKIKSILQVLGIFNLFFHTLAKRMDDEWHLYNFDLDLFRVICPTGLKIVSLARIPFYLLPLRYVIKVRKIS